MKLIIILLCLWLDYYMHIGAKGRQQSYFNRYENFLKDKLGNTKVWEGWFSLITIAAPIFIIVGAIQLYGITQSNMVELILGVVVLLFCLGSSPLQNKLEHYLKPKEGGEKQAESELKEAIADAGISGGDFFRNVTQLQLWQSHERFFAIVFWFLILGPIGAILYRMISWFHDNALHGEAMYDKQLDHMTQIHNWAAWIPARIVALTYTLVGNFMASFDVWLKQAPKMGLVKEILISCGFASLGIADDDKGDKEENEHAQKLVHRALLVWVLIIAVATLGKLFL